MDDLFVYIKKTFKNLENLFNILASSQIVIGVIAFYLVMNNYFLFNQDYERTLKIFILSFNIASFISINAAYIKSRKDGNKSASFEKKITHFRAINTMRMILLAAANIINLALYVLAADHLFLIVFGIMFLLFMYYHPSREIFIKEFDLNEIQKNIILNSRN
ncbi:MAG: hypothetical protein V1720_15260 [bacterium]